MIKARSQQGVFKGPEDIIAIKGIGEKTFNKIAPYVIF
jgi:DNA uptake protein ComE-like DNA-binding protein